MQPQYVTKTLAAPSSNGLGSISTAATSVVTLNSSNLDTGRRILLSSTASSTSATFTVTGFGEQRAAAFTEVVAGSTGGNSTTTSDFIRLTSVTMSSNANIPILIGTSSVGGTQWKSANVHISPTSLSAALTFSSSAVTGQIDMIFDDIWGPNPNPNLSATVPTVYTSTAFSAAATANIFTPFNVVGNTYVSPTAWRLTLTSSSSSAGTVSATVVQSGIGV